MQSTMKKTPVEKKNRSRSENFPIDTVENRLRELRDGIDEIDGRIVSLIAKRQDQVVQVTELKKTHGLPIYHPAREEDLISDRRRQGRDAGLDPDFIEELFRLILKQSRMKQAERMSVKAIRPEATVLVVGGNGSMGRYFRHWFDAAGYGVRVLDRDDWHDVERLCLGVDVAVVAVPIETTVEVIERLAPHLPPRCILSDITSIKIRPMEAMLAAHRGPVLGMHPLFGPTTSSPDKQIIVVTPGRDPGACRWLTDQLAAWGSVVVQADAREHDEIMGVVQTLRHFATFAFGQFLTRKRIDLHRTLEFSSPIYRLELGMVGRLFTQDPSLYAEIILALPERRALLQEYVASLNENLDMIQKGDTTIFCGEFEKIAEWFGPFSEQAMRESTFLIDKLIERF